MKNIDKMFEIKKNNDNSLFSIWELMIISIALSIFFSVITGYAVFLLKDTNALEDKNTKDIVETFNKIKDDYYQNVDTTGLADAAIDGMMEYLGEKYSVYMDDEDTLELTDKLSGSYEGIGIQIIKYAEGNIEIVNVYDDTPAAKAGLEAGDIITEVNGTKVTEETSAQDLTSIIKESDTVNMTVSRDEESLDFEIKTKNLDYPVVETEIFEENDKKIGYIYLQAFSKTATKQVKKALVELEDKGIDALVVDVRSNTGGYLNVADEIGSMFLKKGKILYSVEGKNDKKVIYDETDEMRDYPIAVLIDSATASASEILAASLKESYGAILIGYKSYGKGKVQQTSTLSDATMIKYTTAKWYTPSGNSIDGIGLKPGITVELSKEYALNPSHETDDQLKKAIEFLANE